MYYAFVINVHVITNRTISWYLLKSKNACTHNAVCNNYSFFCNLLNVWLRVLSFYHTMVSSGLRSVNLTLSSHNFRARAGFFGKAVVLLTYCENCC